jgi:hypothetical protein
MYTTMRTYQECTPKIPQILHIQVHSKKQCASTVVEFWMKS